MDDEDNGIFATVDVLGGTSTVAAGSLDGSSAKRLGEPSYIGKQLLRYT